MAIIQIQVAKNFIEDVLLDGGYEISIIKDKLKVRLGLSKPKLAPQNLHLVDETIVKPLGLIKDPRNFVHGIPYAMTFTVIQSSVLYFYYFVLLGCPWLRDPKVFHDWGNNTITLQGVGTVRTILNGKKLGA